MRGHGWLLAGLLHWTGKECAGGDRLAKREEEVNRAVGDSGNVEQPQFHLKERKDLTQMTQRKSTEVTEKRRLAQKGATKTEV
jgi:hypothetical protein